MGTNKHAASGSIRPIALRRGGGRINVRQSSRRKLMRMRAIGNSSLDLGRAPTFRQSRELAFVAIAVAAIASASVILALVDLATKKPDASFVSAWAVVTDFASASPTAPSEKVTAPASAIPLQVREPAAAAAEPATRVAPNEVWKQRDWWKGNSHPKPRSAYWRRSARFRSLPRGSISSER